MPDLVPGWTTIGGRLKKYLLNYADGRFYQAQRKNSASGLSVGGFDACFARRRSDLASTFVQQNKDTLSKPRGAGYWLWKPYVIRRALSEIQFGDLLFYSDSGAYFINPIDSLLPILDSTPNQLLLFSLDESLTHARWTKRDCFVLMELDHDPYLSCGQLLASFIIMKKSGFVVDFIDEWLSYACDYRILTDAPNECGLANYPEFEDHRHDQSILSLLGRKYNVQTTPDISQHGNNTRSRLIPQILNHTRARDSWASRISMLIGER
jgi:hypothetical protein